MPNEWKGKATDNKKWPNEESTHQKGLYVLDTRGSIIDFSHEFPLISFVVATIYSDGPENNQDR